jgi:CBS domain-containing protein
MALLVSAKGSDVLSWRAAGDFAATFRQDLLDRMEFCRSDEADALLDSVKRAIEELSDANDAFGSHCDTLLTEMETCDNPERRRELTTLFYAGLYAHFAVNHSAPAFYQFSTLFLQALARSVICSAYGSLGESARWMPELALVALGPAGRQEFSPFCPLQFMLVWADSDDTDSGLLSRFADSVHEGFASCGLRVDGVVTPRNQQWRGSINEWELRLKAVLERGTYPEVVEILRLADQTVLTGSAETGNCFRQLSFALLAASPNAMNNLVSRVVALSNGIGMIGGLRFERTGPHRGLFALLENGLQPLSASVSVLTLLRHAEGAATPRRIRELLWRRDLDVDMAERLLQAWHTLHELRLFREQETQPDWSDNTPLYLDIDQLNVPEQDSLRDSLEAVGTIQRHIGLNFSGIGE